MFLVLTKTGDEDVSFLLSKPTLKNHLSLILLNCCYNDF